VVGGVGVGSGWCVTEVVGDVGIGIGIGIGIGVGVGVGVGVGGGWWVVGGW
jgi:hypothetical protein